MPLVLSLVVYLVVLLVVLLVLPLVVIINSASKIDFSSDSSSAYTFK